MFNLFSAISGKFSISILTGTCLPVLLFLSCFVWIIEPVAPGFAEVPAPFRALETQSVVLAVAFALALLTGVLAGMNHLLVQCYVSLPGTRWFNIRQLNHLRELRGRLDQYGSNVALADTDKAAANDAINPILTVLAEDFAPEGPALPTRLGNVLANREGYFKARYGISHAVAWWRLAGVMDAPFAAMLDESKASFDFMLNSSFLALIVVLLLLGYSASTEVAFGAFWWRAALFGLISRLAYLGAVDRARAMGNLEKAAIDLYRITLSQKLGMKYDFHSLAEEKAMWSSLEGSLITPDRDNGPSYQPVLPAAPPATSATSNDKSLAIIRSTRAFQTGRYPSAEIELTISDPAGNAHNAVVITDAIPPSWSYLASTARSSGGAATVTGSAPFSATVPISAGTPVTVTYRIQAWRAGNL